MSNNDISLKIHLEEFPKEKIEKILEEWGLLLERNAKENLTNNGSVVYGRLKNSIAYATATHSGETLRYTKDDAKTKPKNYMGKPEKVSTNDENAVYVGTNVYYAAYVELGHINAKTGKNVPPKPYLKPAVMDHKDELEAIAKEIMKE